MERWYINKDITRQANINRWKIIVLSHNSFIHDMVINPLHAKFFRGNKKIYSYFVSFLHIDMTQVLIFLPQVREGPTYSI